MSSYFDVDILIGTDLLYQFILPEKIVVKNNLTFIPTCYGFVIFGTPTKDMYPGYHKSDGAKRHLLYSSLALTKMLREYFNAESYMLPALENSVYSKAQNFAMEYFKSIGQVSTPYLATVL